MKTKIKLLAAASLAVTAGFGANSAFALPYLYPGPVNPVDPVNNYVQLLEDEFFEVLLRRNETSGDLEVLGPIDNTTQIKTGDLFAGVQRIQGTELAAPEGGPAPEPIDLSNGPTFTSIFLIETAKVVDGGAPGADNSTDSLWFKQAGTAAWTEVYGASGLLDISSVFDITDLSSAAGTQAVNADTTILLFYGQPFGDADSTGTLPVSASSYVGIGDLQYEFGFTLPWVEPANANGEFWLTRGTDASFPATTGTNNPLVKFAQNVTQQWDGPDLESHMYRQLLTDGDFKAPTQYQAVGNVSGLSPLTAWPIRGDLDTYLRPVPEPTSTALLSLGLLGLAWGKRRMNKAA
jgi:hypothetical protein